MLRSAAWHALEAAGPQTFGAPEAMRGAVADNLLFYGDNQRRLATGHAGARRERLGFAAQL